uniref:Prepronociceptin n=1 Tax=Spermophilus dauricus TaxID=99837 RepID=A0A8C9UQ29_SPEDA
MKIMLCDLLLLSLLSSVFSSCPRDCLTCREKLHPALDGFNLEVGPGGGEPRPCWTIMGLLARAPWQLSPADPEHVTAALYQPRASEMQHLKRMPRVRSLFQAQKETEPGVDEAGEAEQKQLQKRFGGFTGGKGVLERLSASLWSLQQRTVIHARGAVQFGTPASLPFPLPNFVLVSPVDPTRSWKARGPPNATTKTPITKPQMHKPVPGWDIFLLETPTHRGRLCQPVGLHSTQNL